jgi:hypothetical protein
MHNMCYYIYMNNVLRGNKNGKVNQIYIMDIRDIVFPFGYFLSILQKYKNNPMVKSDAIPSIYYLLPT